MAVESSSGIRNDVLLPDSVREYISEHRLEKVVTSALNCVIQHMPEDPYARLAEELSKSSISAPRFVALRPDTSVPRKWLQFYVVVATRGVNIRIHKLSLGHALCPAHSDAGVQGRDEEKLVFAVQDFFARSFQDVYVDDFLSLHEKCIGMAAHCLGTSEEHLELAASLALTNQLLDAGAAAMNLGSLDFLQHALSKLVPDFVSPPLRSPSDLSNWQGRWPHFAVPLLQGGGPSALTPTSLRCCVALSPMALAEAADGHLTFGWLARLFEVLKGAKAEVIKSLQADKATAALVVDGNPYALPGGLAPTLQLAQKALESAPASDSSKVHGLLIVNAEEAWREEEGVYEVETGKQKSLEELVDFYAEIAEDGWLTTFVNPFREADSQAGAELLRARRPEIKVVQDYGLDVPEPVEELAFSCAWHLAQTLPSALRQYAEQATAWQEVADGFGCCVYLGAQALESMPAILEALLACAGVQVIYMPEEIADDLVKQVSHRQDEVLHRIHAAERNV